MNIVSFSQVAVQRDFRIDSEYYVKLGDENPAIDWVEIRKCLLRSQYGISIDMNEEGIGTPIYRMNEIHNMLTDLQPSKFAIVDLNEAAEYRLRDRDVLFNRTNSFALVGRTGLHRIVDSDERIFASYLVRLTANQEIVLPEYLVAFLNTRRGVADIKRRARMSINQANVNPEEVKDVRIPLVGMKLQEEIKRLFDKAHSLRAKAVSGQQKAALVLESVLELEKWAPPRPLTYVKSAEQVFVAKRFDAEHFQEQYQATRDALQRAGATIMETVEDQIVSITNGQTPLRHDLTQGEIPFLCAEHVSDFTIDYESDKRVTAEQHAEFLSRTRLQPGDMLLTIKGRVGNFGMVQDMPGPANINQDVALLRLKGSIDPWYFMALMNSRLGKMFVNQYSTGAINPFLGLGNVVRLPVARFPARVEAEIASSVRAKVGEARTLRESSERQLEIAKRSVEIAIEESEESALKYIKENSSASE